MRSREAEWLTSLRQSLATFDYPSVRDAPWEFRLLPANLIDCPAAEDALLQNLPGLHISRKTPDGTQYEVILAEPYISWLSDAGISVEESSRHVRSFTREEAEDAVKGILRGRKLLDFYRSHIEDVKLRVVVEWSALIRLSVDLETGFHTDGSSVSAADNESKENEYLHHLIELIKNPDEADWEKEMSEVSRLRSHYKPADDAKTS